jgi:DNA-binding transcriptional regulator of glucitol operon
VRERWLSKRAVSLHIAVLFFVPGCAAAAWWQITRAEDGNGLSYLYSVEWPIFAFLAVYFWWMLIHTDYDSVGLKGMRNRQASASAPASVSSASVAPASAPEAARETVAPTGTGADENDPELAAYNARLAQLANDGPKTWRRPETHVARRAQ